MSTTPADSLNTSRSEGGVSGGWIGSPIASEYLRSFRSMSPSQSPMMRSLAFERETQPGTDGLTELRERISLLEEQRLQLTSTHNEQVTTLEAEVARWRDEAERGEATRQRLEYELAVVKKALNTEREAARKNDLQLRASVEKHQASNTELSDRVEGLTKTLRLREEEMLKVVSALKTEINGKESELGSLREQNSKLWKDKEQVEKVFTEQESLYSDAQEKLGTICIERDTQTETVRRQLKELQYATERQERFKKEMEVALTKIKSLEEATEAERAAHLETKFNSELIQLRVRDMQGAMEMEKSTRSELSLKTEAMTKQISELEALYNKENSTALSLRTQLERAESELCSLKARLTSEVDGKHAMVTDMSEQLDIHQKSFSELKGELLKAKKRQAYLEDTYGGCMRELNLFVSNIQQPSTTNKKRRGQQTESLSPSEVMAKLQQTMHDFQKRLNNASKEVAKLKGSCEKINKECEQYKEVMWRQDKTNKDLQKKYSAASKELEKVRHMYGEHRSRAETIEAALQRVEQDRHSEKTKGQDLTDELIRQMRALEGQLEGRTVFLHSLYDRMKSGANIPGLKTPTLPDPVDWSQLSVAVQEQVAALMIAYSQTDMKVSQLTASLERTDDQLRRLQNSHEESLQQLKETGVKREHDWSSQRNKLEKQYERQLTDLKTKAKRTEETAQSAWHSAQTASSIQGELETACHSYQQQLEDTKDKLNSALIACSLILGALWVHRAQVVDLVKQRSLLIGQLERFYALRSQLEVFATTVVDTMGGNGGSGKSRSGPLLTFRRGVVAVLAANRLRYMATRKAAAPGEYQELRDRPPSLPIYIWPTCLTKIYIERSMPFISCGTHHCPRTLWVTEGELLTLVHESVTQLKMNLQTDENDGDKLLPQSAHQSLNRLLSRLESALIPQLPPNYPSLTLGQLPQDDGLVLVRRLANGLHRALGHRPGRGETPNPYSALGTLLTLKKQFVGFTKRLHSAEVERRTLRSEISQAREENQILLQSGQRAELLERELVDLKTQRNKLIDKEKFDGVCDELTQALQREHQAQQVLNEQNDQIGQLNLRLNVRTTNDIKKERTIAEAVQGLTNASSDLKRRELSIHELKRKVIGLEDEKQTLRDRMREMERRMKEKTKDKEDMLLYLKSLEAIVEKVRRNLLHKPDSHSYQGIFNQLLSSASVTDVKLKEPEANTLQSLLQAFVDAQKTAVNRIGMLEEEVVSHKQHINSLKKELGAVCRRERAADQALCPSTDPSGVMSAFPSLSSKLIGQSQGYSYHEERSYAEEFAPLREAIDYSGQNTPSKR